MIKNIMPLLVVCVVSFGIGMLGEGGDITTGEMLISSILLAIWYSVSAD